MYARILQSFSLLNPAAFFISTASFQSTFSGLLNHVPAIHFFFINNRYDSDTKEKIHCLLLLLHRNFKTWTGKSRKVCPFLQYLMLTLEEHNI